MVVATYDRPEFLPDCLASVVASLGPGDELLVVEAGDSQAAAAISTLPRVVTHVQLPRPGKSRQLNEALARSVGDIVVFTDDDCRVAPSWVTAMVAPFARDPRVAIAFGPVQGLTHVPGSAAPVGPPPGEAPFVTWTYAHGASFAVRREALAAIGGFDERLGPGAPAHGEEHDVLLRLREDGWRAEIADAPAVIHLDWRDARETLRNVLTYERGSGAFLGAALRRSRGPNVALLKHRLGYQAQLIRDRDQRSWTLGPRALASFLGGLVYGLRLDPAERNRSS